MPETRIEKQTGLEDPTTPDKHLRLMKGIGETATNPKTVFVDFPYPKLIGSFPSQELHWGD